MSYVDAGFNCITKSLQAQSQPSSDPETKSDTCRPYSTLFVARGDQSSAFNSHFPQMVGAATRSMPDADKTRLVGFSRACSEKLSMALGIPRVSAIALVADAPGSAALQDVVRRTVPVISIPWLPTHGTEAYQPTKITSVETTVGTKKSRSS